MSKTMTVRLDESRAELLEMIAEGAGISQNQVMLSGLDAIADKFRQDDEFKERVTNAIERRQRVLDLLA